MKQRFPRWELTQSEKLVMSILRMTYNKMAIAKDERKRTFTFDVYQTKIGVRARFAFLLLAPKLVKLGIDPGMYVKVMCQYGHYRRSVTMPHPMFLASQKGLDTYSWLVKRRKEVSGSKEDWKEGLNVWTREDAYVTTKSAARIFKEAKKQLGVPNSQAFLAIFKELSPMFIAGYIYYSDEWRRVRKALKYLRHNPEIWGAVLRAIRSELDD